MLRVANLTLARGTKRLLENASLTVHDRHKVGLVGANGSGKSSLFAADTRRAHARCGRRRAAAALDALARRAGNTGGGDTRDRLRARR